MKRQTFLNSYRFFIFHFNAAQTCKYIHVLECLRQCDLQYNTVKKKDLTELLVIQQFSSELSVTTEKTCIIFTFIVFCCIFFKYIKKDDQFL